MSDSNITERIKEIEELKNKGHIEASYIMTWATLEAAAAIIHGYKHKGAAKIDFIVAIIGKKRNG